MLLQHASDTVATASRVSLFSSAPNSIVTEANSLRRQSVDTVNKVKRIATPHQPGSGQRELSHGGTANPPSLLMRMPASKAT